MGPSTDIDIRRDPSLVGPLIDFRFDVPWDSKSDLWQLCSDTYLCGRRIYGSLKGLLEEYEKKHANFRKLLPLLSGLDRTRLERTDYAIVVQLDAPFTGPSGDGPDIFEPLRAAVLAIRLVAGGPLYANPLVSLSAGEVQEHRIMLDRPTQFSVSLPGIEAPPDLSALKEDHLPTLQRLVPFVRKAFQNEDSFPRLLRALRFYELSWRSVHPDIRAVLLWTVLECLFHEEGICSGRAAATCAAAMLSADAREGQDRKKNFEGLYCSRCRVVHGERLGPNEKARKEAIRQAYYSQEHLRELFVGVCERGMIEHFRSKESWAAWVCRLLEGRG